jgi:hypothetical protein
MFLPNTHIFHHQVHTKSLKCNLPSTHIRAQTLTFTHEMIDQYVTQSIFTQNSNYSKIYLQKVRIILAHVSLSLLSPKIYFQLIRYYSLAFLSKNHSVKKSCPFNIKQKPILSTKSILGLSTLIGYYIKLQQPTHTPKHQPFTCFLTNL